MSIVFAGKIFLYKIISCVSQFPFKFLCSCYLTILLAVPWFKSAINQSQG